MLTGKQRSYLKSLANGIEPIFQVGKGSINDNMIKQFNDALEARELIKINVLKNSPGEPVKFVKKLLKEQTQKLYKL